MTNQELAAEVMRESYNKPHWSPMHRCDNMAQALADAGLLMPDNSDTQYGTPAQDVDKDGHMPYV